MGSHPHTFTYDCAGVVNGSATLDECGVCDGSGIAEGACDCDGTLPQENFDCAGNCLVDTDCAGVCGGDAVVDECGVCDGSGIADGACDCNGNVDLGCGCGEAGPSGCDEACGSTAVVDCAGVCGGTAEFDICGVCDGPGLNDSGCCGDDLSDCNGTCFDSSLLGWATDGYCDSSGYLPGYTTPGYGLNFLCEEYNYDDGMCDIYQDCAGAYFGSAVVDCAGTCGGSAVEDYCGVCNGTNVANECEEAPNPCLVAGGVLVNMFDSYGDGWGSNS